MSTRGEHQPSDEVVVHEPLSPEAQRDACGKTAAIIMLRDWNATPLRVTYEDSEKDPYLCDGRDGDPQADAVELPRPLQLYEGKPLVEHALRLAQESSFSGVEVVLCDPPEEAEDSIRAVIDHAAAQNDADPRPLVATLSLDELESARRLACNFEFLCIPAAIIIRARQILQADSALESVLIMSCDEPRLTPWHLAQLCLRLQGQPSTDAVCSWIMWARRLPVLLSRRFFDSVDAQGLDKLRKGSPWRPLPALEVEDYVFGEETLQPNESSSTQRDRFFDDNPISALEAVRLARRLKELAGHVGADATESAAEAKKLIAELTPSSKRLVGIAQALLAKLDEELEQSEGFHLRLCDAWGKRNKRDFPLLMDRKHRDSLVFLDSAATAQRLDCAIQAERDFNVHENSNIYRGAYELSAQATASYNEARAVIERHINAQRRQLVLCANTTMAANIAAQAWGLRNLKKDDVVLVSISEHHSNMMPWRIAAEARGARVEYIPLRPDGRIDMDAYRELLKLCPRLACVAQISNVLGLVNPVDEMARLAHAVGARFFLDAAQSFPHLDIDVESLGCDFLAFSGHKVYGPLGIGGLWISDAAFEEMDPLMCGGGAVSHVGKHSYYLRKGAIQYEVGTPPIAQAIGLAAAIDHLEGLGMHCVEEHSAALTEYLVKGLSLLDGITVWGDHAEPDGQTGLVSFSVAGVSCARLAQDLGRLQVCVRSGGQCALPFHAMVGLDGTARISIGIHNTAEDIEAALVAVAMCSELSAGRNALAFMKEEDDER